MYQIIAPTLFQNKICRLPGIGTLTMIQHPAKTEFVNNLINSPTETIEFLACNADEKLFNEFSAMSELLKRHLENKGSYVLNGIGTFMKEGEGAIKFLPVTADSILTPPVPAERVIRQDAEHAILVGDQQTTNTEMSEFFSGKAPLKNYWWVWAAALAAIAIAALAIYIYQYGFNQLTNMLIK
ncbi:MAG: hypothetical protein H7211_01355 [Aquabacterium sp.]|nr:hypothetical protein [Ferruginibacter sp.]